MIILEAASKKLPHSECIMHICGCLAVFTSMRWPYSWCLTKAVSFGYLNEAASMMSVPYGYLIAAASLWMYQFNCLQINHIMLFQGTIKY